MSVPASMTVDPAPGRHGLGRAAMVLQGAEEEIVSDKVAGGVEIKRGGDLGIGRGLVPEDDRRMQFENAHIRTHADSSS